MTHVEIETLSNHQPTSGGSLGASQSGYLDMASLREDIAGSIVREPPPYPRCSIHGALPPKIIEEFMMLLLQYDRSK